MASRIWPKMTSKPQENGPMWPQEGGAEPEPETADDAAGAASEAVAGGSGAGSSRWATATESETKSSSMTNTCASICAIWRLRFCRNVQHASCHSVMVWIVWVCLSWTCPWAITKASRPWGSRDRDRDRGAGGMISEAVQSRTEPGVAMSGNEQ